MKTISKQNSHQISRIKFFSDTQITFESLSKSPIVTLGSLSKIRSINPFGKLNFSSHSSMLMFLFLKNFTISPLLYIEFLYNIKSLPNQHINYMFLKYEKSNNSLLFFIILHINRNYSLIFHISRGNID